MSSVGRYFFNLYSANRRLLAGIRPGFTQFSVLFVTYNIELFPKEILDVKGKIKKFIWTLCDLEVVGLHEPAKEVQSHVKLNKQLRF
jgi:hypothetical protein